VEHLCAQVPFEALKREARCRKAMVERLQDVCARVNSMSSGKVVPGMDTEENMLLSIQAEIEQLKKQVRVDHM